MHSTLQSHRHPEVFPKKAPTVYALSYGVTIVEKGMNEDPMLGYLESLDLQIEEALQISDSFDSKCFKRSIEKVLFCGMGGSSIGGDIWRVLFEERSQIPFSVLRSGHSFPQWADSNTLVVLSSHSGNTQEVLDIAFQAAERKCQVLVVSSGGLLMDWALGSSKPKIKIPAGMPPRTALGYLFFSLKKVMEKAGGFKISSLELDNVMAVVKSVNHEATKNTARLIYDRAVFISGWSGFLEPAVTRWKTQLAENSKTLASISWMPEMFHNDIEGWKHPAKHLRERAMVFLLDDQQPSWMLAKQKYVSAWIRSKGAKVHEVQAKGKYPLSRLFSLILAGDWTSYELAQLCQENPLPIPVLDAVKAISKRGDK